MARNAMVGSICLSDIPEQCIAIGKDGKKYVTVVFEEMPNPGEDKYGNTHHVKIPKRYSPEDPYQHVVGNFRPFGPRKEFFYRKSPNRI